MRQPIAIGVENYKTIIENNYYYIDKTWMLKELADQKGTVNLFTRPRRFGKTLTLSMVRTFFEDERNYKGEKIDNSRYFAGKKIMEAGEKYIGELGQYPVIKLSLKSAKQPNYQMAYGCLRSEIIYEYDRHRYVLEGDFLTEEEKDNYRRILAEKAEPDKYATAIRQLSYYLKKYHGRNAIILIDEYDVPLENAYFRGFYDQMIDFIRSLFESALKTNDALEFAIVTGCLRISKESIFTGLNNLEINSVLSNNYAEYFGFTGEEVEQMLKNYGLEEKLSEVKQWYDGYLFGETEVYNPWSIINYVKTAISESQPFPKPYWSNTSSNSIIRELVEEADSDTKEEIQMLIDGKTIEKPVHEDITYGEIHKSKDNLWNFLFFTGYLKVVSKRFEDRRIYLTMSIPNDEVLTIYEDTIREWFDRQTKAIDFTPFYRAILDGDCSSMQKILKENLRRAISYYDNKEAFYHGMLLGFLLAMPDYVPKSNRECGNGRPDIALVPYDEEAPVIIMELKVCKKFTEMAEGCQAALDQIEEKDYAAPFLDKGYTKIMKYGICFCEKTCMVEIR
ncbi:MAG: ATP-binding protein [Agathobacter sp.]|nr:ATP-binding protein [Agathobacter sp.]